MSSPPRSWPLATIRYGIWLACIASSLLTTKALMVGGMSDRPLTILFAQITSVAIVAMARPSSFDVKTGRQPIRSTSQASKIGMAWFIILVALDSGCLIVAYKILRFSGSLPGAVMLLSISGLQMLHVSRGRALPDSASRYVLLLIGCSFIVLGDFRLNKTSRDLSVVWLVLSAFGTLISERRLPHCLHPNEVTDRSKQSLLWTLIPVGLGVLLDEGISFPSRSIEAETIILLLMDIALTNTIWLLSESSFEVQDPDDGGRNTPLTQSRWSNSDLRIHLLFSGAVSLSSWLLRGSAVFVSPVQFIGYLTALAAIVSSPSEDPRRSVSSQSSGGSERELSSHPLENSSRACQHHSNMKLDPSNSGVKHERSRANIVLLPCAAFMLWISFWSLMLANADYREMSATPVDRGYVAPADLDIVVAAYDRPAGDIAQDLNTLLDLPSLQDLSTRVFVYYKGQGSSVWHFELTQALNNRTELLVSRNENKGREGATYLHHITTHWSDLARHTLFLQEHAHDLGLMKQRIADYFVEQTGFMPLSYQGKLWNQCDDIRSNAWPAFAKAVDRTVDLARPLTQCHDLILTYRGQFLVSAARLRGNDRKSYEQLLKDLLDLGSWMHEPEYIEPGITNGNPDSLADPAYGYVLERLWGEILGCSDPRHAYRSPSMLASYVRSVWFGRRFPTEDVQCLDRTA